MPKLNRSSIKNIAHATRAFPTSAQHLRAPQEARYQGALCISVALRSIAPTQRGGGSNGWAVTGDRKARSERTKNWQRDPDSPQRSSTNEAADPLPARLSCRCKCPLETLTNGLAQARSSAISSSKRQATKNVPPGYVEVVFRYAERASFALYSATRSLSRTDRCDP
jgi:hypothetical protein